MLAYFYKSQLFNWFSTGTDGIIDALHGHVSRAAKGFPMAEIKAYFSSRGREVELTRAHLDNVRLRYLLLGLVYVEQTGVGPFNQAFQHNLPHVDHIYPKSMLQSRLSVPTAKVNHIGNYRLVGASDNLRKRAELPQSYFKRLKDAGVDLRRHLLVQRYAADPSRLSFDKDTYYEFVDARTEAIWELVRRVVNPDSGGSE